MLDKMFVDLQPVRTERAELEAHIEKLKEDIEKQKEVVRVVRNDLGARAEAQDKLKASEARSKQVGRRSSLLGIIKKIIPFVIINCFSETSSTLNYYPIPQLLSHPSSTIPTKPPGRHQNP